MMLSMTGYGRQESQEAFGRLVWELRSVNHRYQEIQFRLPEEFRVLESAFREQIGTVIKRGKVDASLRFEPTQRHAATIDIDESFAARLVAAAETVAGISGHVAAIDPLRLMRWPGVVIEPETDFKPLHTAARDLLLEALQGLKDARAAEGARVSRLIQSRCEELASNVVAVRERLPTVRAAMRSKLLARVEEIAVQVDQDRLEQELVYLLQKMDVDEELDRLDSHVTELRAVLARNEPVGRRLDFLMQEFNREANTLGSKSQDVETTRLSMEMKVLIEQMREQVQNVE